MSGKPIDITGIKKGKLTALSFHHSDKVRRQFWLFECDCGNHPVIRKDQFLSGDSASCGCTQFTHKLSRSRIYSTYRNMRYRCTDPNNNRFFLYGGRGIKCLWNSFDEFKADMYESYLQHIKEFGEKNTTIDRIDTNGNYCKENCRWATNKEQNHNRNEVKYGIKYGLNAERNKQIVSYRKLGYPLEKIGKMYGITGTRVYQVCLQGNLYNISPTFSNLV